MNIHAIAFAVLVSFATAQAAIIARDAVVPSTSPTDVIRIWPWTKTATSGGLKSTGSQSAGCKGSGYGSQVYGRAVEYAGVYAFMYSWYMPKGETLPGPGHRYDWEACVIWLDSLGSRNIVALSASLQRLLPTKLQLFDGDSDKVEYSSSYIVIDHSLSATSTAGETQDLIMWDQLTDAACMALEDTDFGGANEPFKEANFETKLANAYYLYT